MTVQGILQNSDNIMKKKIREMFLAFRVTPGYYGFDFKCL